MRLLAAFVALVVVSSAQDAHVKHPELPRLVRTWAEKLGSELWHFGELVTRRTTVIESYRHAVVTPKDGMALLDEIKQRLKDMMDKKVDAVRRIMEIAENVAATAPDDVGEDYDYYNAKDLVDSTAPTEEEQQKAGEEEEVGDADDEPQHQRSDAVVVDEIFSEQEDGDPHADAARRRGASYRHRYASDYQLDQAEVDEVDAAAAAGSAGDKDDEQLGTDDDDDDDDDDEEHEEQEPMASLKPPVDKRRLPLHPNPNFYNIPVNLNVSAVHVPSNVYDRAPEVIRDIKWSEELDKSFRDNYKQDPSISWQYFGSSSGFMRQYPAAIWRQAPVDLFDCRMRGWYVAAASSPKDVVVLIDRSGSMTGMRREIAKHVVNNILDTLGDNDYVNVYTFSNTTDALVECFAGRLVQANLANVRQFKDAMALFHTEQIANFSLALTAAFELLRAYREERAGEAAQCNQAIMLVTDGVHYNFKEIFKEYNWRNLPFMPVRVFTYLIGREVSDVREVKWMACANQGYYVHLSTYAEVREQVLQYLPVMARPMVLNPTLKPHPTWSPVYADATDPKLTNWLWLNRERRKQRDRFLLYRRNRNRTSFFTDGGTIHTAADAFLHRQRRLDFFDVDLEQLDDEEEDDGGEQIYRLMTSVSLPVYDKRQNANISEKVQINEKIWITVTKETRIANLLGVAGTDVPIETIERLMLPYRVGVNGYAFLVTNNGYVLLHPDLRPVFQGILKPAYNRVDVVEVELVDDDRAPRDFAEALLELRAAIVNQTRGRHELRVKYHLDEMSRVQFTHRHYFHAGVDGTPFTLVVALPDRYGLAELEARAPDDKHRLFVTHNNNLTQFFTGAWTVHPAWTYCRYVGAAAAAAATFATPAAQLRHFLERMSVPGWRWNNTSRGVECDRALINRVLYDAKATEWFHKNITANPKPDDNGPIGMLMALLPRHEFIARFGITVAFLATHSGLTRWQDFPQNGGGGGQRAHFAEVHARAVDEVWYRRAVEQHYRTAGRAFVYAVPFDADWLPRAAAAAGALPDEVLVTATHAIFKEKAAVGVVGFQMRHRALHALFQNITGQCGDERCKRTCSSEELHCMLVDDGGYVVVAYDRKRTGAFLGDFRPDILALLVAEGVYNRTRIVDYQATCFPNVHAAAAAAATGNSAPPSPPRAALFTQHLRDLFAWLLATLAYTVRTVVAHPDDDVLHATVAAVADDAAAAAAAAAAEEEQEEDDGEGSSRTFEKDLDRRLLINKTHPETCDAELYLYHLQLHTAGEAFNRTMRDCERPFLVQPVVASNLVLLVVNMLCAEAPLDAPLPGPTPVDVRYNESRHCHILRHNQFARRNYMSCINRSIHEQTIQLCGSATATYGPQRALLAAALSLLLLLLVVAS